MRTKTLAYNIFAICALFTLALLVGGCATKAKAATLVTENGDGGQIVLTDRPCELKGQIYEGIYRAYTWGQNSAYSEGCWTIVDGDVHVVYERSGKRRVYPVSAFRRKD